MSFGYSMYRRKWGSGRIRLTTGPVLIWGGIVRPYIALGKSIGQLGIVYAVSFDRACREETSGLKGLSQTLIRVNPRPCHYLP